jgi:NTP pyrophosphatase (non-canonical NTP hydrolase)
MWQMQETVAQFDASRFRSLGPGYIALSLAGEAGELANVVKKAWRADPLVGQPSGYESVSTEHRALLADELADVVMLSLVLANHLGIDIEAEVERKLTTIDERLGRGYYGHDQVLPAGAADGSDRPLND